MRFKLDENLGGAAFRLFAAAGHDTSTVQLQNIAGAHDLDVFDLCKAERRVLVTLDLDFSNPLNFDPRTTSGVAVLRLSRNPSPSELGTAIATFLSALDEHSIDRSLWVIRNGRVRVWDPPSDDLI